MRHLIQSTNKAYESMSIRKSLYTLCLILLVWASLASAFSQALMTACEAVMKDGVNAEPQYKALVLKYMLQFHG